ncbi:alpha/beta fold hydrolase [Gordonia sp. NPDC003424]
MLASDNTSHAITVNGDTEIFYTDIGTGDPVVLLHGGGPGASGLSNYVRNIDALAARFRVIVPDLPGYGRSSKNLQQTDPFGALADAIRALLDHLGLDSAHLVGNSYGGACALRLALDTPHRVDRLVLMGPGGIGTTRGAPTKGLNALLGYYTGSGPSRDKLEDFIRTYLVYDAEAVPDNAIEERYRSSVDPDVVANPPLRRPSGLGALKTLWRMDFTRDPRLRTLTTRTLVIWGQNDKVNRPAGGQMLVDRMPNADLMMPARTGHWVQWERPDLFNRVVADFLDGTYA